MTIDELVSAVKDKMPPAPADELEAFEAELGEPLPEDYRRFLIECNGGYVSGIAGVHHIGGLRPEDLYSLQLARENLQGDELRIPLALLWIMDDNFGNAICLGLTGKHRGRVYLWDHENEPDPDEWDGKVETADNVQLLANSFTEFVAGL